MRSWCAELSASLPRKSTSHCSPRARPSGALLRSSRPDPRSTQGSAMRAVDTNVLVRLLARDDLKQASAADSFVAPGAWVSHLVKRQEERANGAWRRSAAIARGRPKAAVAVSAAWPWLASFSRASLRNRLSIFWPVCGELVSRNGCNIRNLGEGRQEAGSRATLGTCLENLLSIQCGHLLSHRTSDELVDRNALALSEVCEALVQGLGKAKAQGAHESLIFLRKTAGVMTATPSSGIRRKSRRLCVTKKSADDPNATSATMSSFGSATKGRQRK